MALARYAIHDASASQAMRGCGLLMPLLDKANASDNAVAELSNTFEPPSVALLEFGPHHLAGSITDPLVAPRLSYLHVYPRLPSSPRRPGLTRILFARLRLWLTRVLSK